MKRVFKVKFKRKKKRLFHYLETFNMLKKIGHLILFSYMYLTVYYFKSLQERFLGKLFYFAKIKYRISLTRNRHKANFGWKK